MYMLGTKIAFKGEGILWGSCYVSCNVHVLSSYTCKGRTFGRLFCFPGVGLELLVEGGGGSWMLRAGGDWSPPLLPTALPVGDDKPLPPPPLPPSANVFFSFILLNILSFSFPIGPGVEAVGAGNHTKRGFFKCLCLSIIFFPRNKG